MPRRYISKEIWYYILFIPVSQKQTDRRYIETTVEAMLIRSDAYAHVRRLILYSADFERDMPDNPYLALEPSE